ncbi:MAG: hypothetical protein DCC58_10470 [Chloroflexi bacterium]|nr:MAG: hypothetical protein DCC58_10470 [Chloroflexota bacterium]
MNRRTFFRAGLTTALGLIAAGLPGAARNRAQALDNCYWQTQIGPSCIGGRWKAYRCSICCQPCEVVYCQWQDLGPC